MATIINGTDMVLKVNPGDSETPSTGTLTAIAAATSCTVSITVDTGEVTDKQSGDRKEFHGLSSSWTMDADVFYNEDGTDDMQTLFPAMYGDSEPSQNGVVQYPRYVAVEFQGSSATYSGNGYITSISASGGTEDAGTYTVSIQGTGALAQG
jgi:predicted secreted protein